MQIADSLGFTAVAPRDRDCEKEKEGEREKEQHGNHGSDVEQLLPPFSLPPFMKHSVSLRLITHAKPKTAEWEMEIKSKTQQASERKRKNSSNKQQNAEAA